MFESFLNCAGYLGYPLLMTHHLTNMEIAERLVLSSKTVRNHVSNIFSKLQVVSRAQAIMRARDENWEQEHS